VKWYDSPTSENEKDDEVPDVSITSFYPTQTISYDYSLSPNIANNWYNTSETNRPLVNEINSVKLLILLTFQNLHVNIKQTLYNPLA